MISQLSLYTLKPDITPERMEELMWVTRTTLLKIPEVLALRTGKRISDQDTWHWFVTIETESLDKLAICRDDPHYFKFLQEVIRSSVQEEQVHTFEMEPRKDVKYS